MQRGAGEQPGDQRERGEAEHDGDEDTGDAVCEALDLRLGGLRALDQRDQLRERSFGADGGGAGVEHTIDVQRGARDEVARALLDRERLAGEHRLVDGG